MPAIMLPSLVLDPDDVDARALTQHADSLGLKVHIFRATVQGERTYLVVDRVLRPVWKGAADRVRVWLDEQAEE